MAQKRTIKELIDENSVDTYQTLYRFYKDVVNGVVTDVRVLKDGSVVPVPMSAAVRIEAANALLRMNIDKVQGNAKAKETEQDLTAGGDALKMLQDLANKKQEQ